MERFHVGLVLINLPICFLSFRSSQNSVPSTVISQDFFTCPNSPQDEQQTPFASTSVSGARNFERLSPSPEKEINYVVTTNTDYPWTSIEELLLNEGQLISKCPYEKSVSSKTPTKIFLDFRPEIFCSFLGGFLVAFWASSSLPYL